MFPPCSLHVPATKYNPVAHMTFEFVQDKWHAAIYIYIYIHICIYTCMYKRSRVSRADATHPSKPWVECIWQQQWNFVAHLNSSACAWPRLLAAWQPTGYREQGRPFLRWDDHINSFCRMKFQCDNWSNLSSTQMLRYASDFSTFATRS